jgi:hypothetical protein
MEIVMIMNDLRSICRVLRPAVLALAVVAMSSAAQAQKKPSAQEMAAAKELTLLIGAADVSKPLIAGVVEQAKVVFLQQNPALSNDLNEISEKLRNELEPRISEFTDEVARLYALHFTEDELKAILAFYKSPVGKKMQAQQPLIVNASGQFAQEWASNLSDVALNRMRDELKKKGHDL